MSVDYSRDLLLGYRLELSYALVGDPSLDPLPQVDELFALHCGESVRKLERENVSWSSRGPRHSLQVAPRLALPGLADAQSLVAGELEVLHELAGEVGGCLLATGMHPWMLASSAEVWPHSAQVDSVLHSLFGARRHGWSNQQRLLLSLPFADETEFARLFAVLRFAMPLMPALSASSPFVEGARGPAMQCRLAAARDYVGTDPAFASSLVPDPAMGRDQYRNEALAPLQRTLQARGMGSSLQPLDVCGHGLVADFERGLIHICMLDMQECLQADLGVCAGVVAIASHLLHENALPHRALSQWPSARLAELVELTLVDGQGGILRDADFLHAFEFPGKSCRMSELLQFLIEEVLSKDRSITAHMPVLSTIARQGSLARRCLSKLPENWNEEDLYNLYRKLASSLRQDELL